MSVKPTIWEEYHLKANLGGEGEGEDIVGLAEVEVPRVVLVHGVLRGDGQTGNMDQRESDKSLTLISR